MMFLSATSVNCRPRALTRRISRALKPTAIVALGLLFFALVAVAAETVCVGDLELKVKQDWGEVHRNQSADGNSLTIGGQKFDHGFGTHANSTLRLGLDGRAESFTARVGVDDEITDVGTITFTVTGDGRKLWESSAMNFGDAPVPVTVDLHGIQTLVLTARDGGDGNNHDHADWAEPAIVMTSSKPVVLDPEATNTISISSPTTKSGSTNQTAAPAK